MHCVREQEVMMTMIAQSHNGEGECIVSENKKG